MERMCYDKVTSYDKGGNTMECKVYPGMLSGSMCAPASKSEAHRKMICAGLTDGITKLTNFMDSEDLKATRNCLRALGASIQREGDTLTVTGINQQGRRRPVMDCGESGSTLRFFVPLAMVLAGGGTFVMHGRLGQRPMDVYKDLFVPRGVSWRMGVGVDGAAELHVVGKVEAGEFVLPGSVSSQFVSGLLFALPMLEKDSVLRVLPPVESTGYIHMTLQALADSGIVIRPIGEFAWQIPGGQKYHSESGMLTGDYSQGAVFLCAQALGHAVTVEGLEEKTLQGDAAVVSFLQKLGCTMVQKNGTWHVKEANLKGTTLSMRDCPDIAPIMALVCQMAEGESRLTGCGRLRLKECDRLQGTVEILNQLGGCARAEGNDIII